MRGEMVVRDVERQFETEAVVSRVVSKMQDGPASRRHRQARRARIPYGSSTKLSRASIEVPTMVTDGPDLHNNRNNGGRAGAPEDLLKSKKKVHNMRKVDSCTTQHADSPRAPRHSSASPQAG
jgi:hypothetical protein